jgi:hypothetical protein
MSSENRLQRCEWESNNSDNIPQEYNHQGYDYMHSKPRDRDEGLINKNRKQENL